ncbi:DinB family protein [Flavihumibacter sp. RY-1]|uniref:DinB family protein n=1 Tax=Flavihumibacter fluminis TaxID=2909236 RepID=A0ABS9BFI3_9BACT|nr:DinB family protein [Flavihumibacter fluminis]MCF1714362.1 DinB family protein [Flavihumibacter fluminis]
MKKISCLLALVTLFSFTSIAPDPISDADRAQLVAQLESTRDLLLKTVEGLSEEQFNYRAAEGKWTVLECLEHITLSESALMGWVQQSLQTPADPSKRSEVKVSDADLLEKTPDRSQKFNAPEMLQPKGSQQNAAALLKTYQEARVKTLEYAKTTKDDLRNHFIQHPAFGTIDTYQGLLMLSAHSKRHTLQMQEVKANANFPK